MINSVLKVYDGEIELNTLIVTYDDGTVWSIPTDESNRHYQEVLQWVADGNEIGEPE